MATNLEKLLGGQDVGLALLQALAENSFDSVLITDASKEGKIIYANKAFKKLTGYEPDAVIGKTPRILQGAGTDAKVIDRLSVALKALFVDGNRMQSVHYERFRDCMNLRQEADYGMIYSEKSAEEVAEWASEFLAEAKRLLK